MGISMEGYHLLKSDNTNISREELEKEIERLKVELKSVRDELKNKSKLSTSVANISSNQNSINDELLIQFSENIREVFWLHDCVNDKTMFVSPSFNKIFGVSLDNYEDAANFWKDAIHEDDKDLMNESFKKLAEGSTSETIEYRIVKPDGEVRWVSDYMWTIYNDKNEVVEIAGVTEDITETKVMQNELLQSENKFRSVFEDSYDCIFLISSNGRIIDVNDSGLSLFELDKSNVLGKHFTIYFYEKESAKSFIKTIIEEGIVKEFRTKFLRRDGSFFDGMLTAFSRRDENNNIVGYQGIIRSITLQNKYKKELIDAKEEAEKANDLKTEFLTQMSHEIRTPINTLLSFSSLIREEIKGNLTDQLRQYFGYQVSAGSRIVKTIDSILNMSELQTGTFKTNIKRINLLDTLNSVYTEYLSIADNGGLELKLLTAGNVFPVMADEYSVHQIFRNLIDNSIKYTSSGEISVSIFEKKKFTRVEVIDTGIGMTEEYMKIIFQPFTQEEQGYTRKFEGAGLGLALVKKYCELNNAKIQVESKKGEGTKFTILFNTAN
jgi:PAS domain S-box-containing protein